jgi:hypothetical protein
VSAGQGDSRDPPPGRFGDGLDDHIWVDRTQREPQPETDPDAGRDSARYISQLFTRKTILGS